MVRCDAFDSFRCDGAFFDASAVHASERFFSNVLFLLQNVAQKNSIEFVIPPMSVFFFYRIRIYHVNSKY